MHITSRYMYGAKSSQLIYPLETDPVHVNRVASSLTPGAPTLAHLKVFWLSPARNHTKHGFFCPTCSSPQNLTASWRYEVLREFRA